MLVATFASLAGCYLSHERADELPVTATMDAGVAGRRDAALADGGPRDAGIHDAAMLDASVRDAGSDAGASSVPDAGDAGDECRPRGEMVEVSGARPYRIDVTEVTQREYARFLRCAPSAPVPPGCAGVAVSPGPAGDFDPIAYPNHPVRDVSWCEAGTYCQWAGKRLCKLDDEWMPACLATRARVAPGGMVTDARACVLAAFADGVWSGTDVDVPQPVQSAPDCRGLEPPFDAVFDIMGNVSELVTRAESPPSQYAGYSSTSGPHSPCLIEGHIGIHDRRGDFGFRCCAD